MVYLQPGTLDINRRPIIIEPDPDPDPDPDPVPELRRVKTEKEADREAAAVGDVITYKITVTNIGSVELKDIPVRDTNDGSGRITAAGGPGYTWHEDSGTWTIHRLPVGKSITITYTYEVVEADDGKDITNVAVTTVPGTNPEDPDNPGHGIDPEKPIDPDTEYPSDEVVVPVDPDREPDPDPDPVDGRSITIVKFTDTAFAAVGDTIGYTDTAAPTPPQVYVAEINGVETTFTLASMEQTSDYSWRDVDFTTVWYGRQLADFYLGKIQPGSAAIPFDPSNPRYAGYEAVLLQYLGLDADTCRIVDSEWRQLDEPWQNTLRHQSHSCKVAGQAALHLCRCKTQFMLHITWIRNG